jgi:hypothetical protein
MCVTLGRAIHIERQNFSVSSRERDVSLDLRGLGAGQGVKHWLPGNWIGIHLATTSRTRYYEGVIGFHSRAVAQLPELIAAFTAIGCNTRSISAGASPTRNPRRPPLMYTRGKSLIDCSM